MNEKKKKKKMNERLACDMPCHLRGDEEAAGEPRRNSYMWKKGVRLNIAANVLLSRRKRVRGRH